jgi:hypothetical protein
LDTTVVTGDGVCDDNDTSGVVMPLLLLLLQLWLMKVSGLMTNLATSTYSYLGVNAGLVDSDGLL